jgi:ubiquinone/menaquinone biosynthesis C-methylase UbiE
MRSQSSKDDIRERFGAHAAAYATSRVHAEGASLGRLVDLVRPRAHWRVLDVATGAGHTALAFAPHVASVVATDITPQMLAQSDTLSRARGAANVTTRIADAEALPFEDQSFDLVTCRIAPHHFGDVARFVREAARVLRPRGTFALVDNVTPDDAAIALWIDTFEHTRDPTHHHCLNVEKWKALCEAARLTVAHTEIVPKAIDLADWARRMQTPAPIVARLRTMLLEAPAPVRQWLQPVSRDHNVTFRLWEGIVIAHVTAE